MLIGAGDCAPVRCIDCSASLPRIQHGYAERHIAGGFHLLGYPYSGWFVGCSCGCVYIWSYDETFENGGVWRRYHVLALFSDRQRLPIVKRNNRKQRPSKKP